jgi:hypothetical protein
VGNTVTITTASAHGLRAGQVVTITSFGSGGIAAGYRGTFTVASVPSPTTFTYTNPISGLPPSGGGFAVVSGQAAYGWLTSIFPGIGVVQESAFSLTGVTVTPQGAAAFPGLTSADLSTGPWHNYFVVPPTITVLTPLATAVNNAGQTVPLILTSIGAPPTQALIVTIDTAAPATPGLDLRAASDSGLSAADDLTNFNNATAALAPTFDVAVGAGEVGVTVQLFRAPAPGGVAGAPVLVNTLVNQAGGTVSIADINQPDPTLPASGPAIPDGPYVYTYRVIDLAGNISPPSPPLAVRIDATRPSLPSAPVLLPADDTGVAGDGITNVPQPRLVGTVALAPGEDPPTVQLIDAAGAVLGQAVAVPRPASPAVGDYLVTLNVAVPPGVVAAFTLRARAVDRAGNPSAPPVASYALTIDRRVPGGTTAPAPPTLALSPATDSGTPGDNVTNVRRPILIGAVGTPTPGTSGPTASPNPRIDLILVSPSSPAPLLATTQVAADGSFQVQFPSDLADGTYQVRVRAYDQAGNEAFSPVLTLTIDTVAPTTVPSLGLRPDTDAGIKGDGRTSARRPVLVGRTEPGAAVDVIGPGGAVLASTRSGADGAFAAQLAAELVNGAIDLRARLSDAAGNAGPIGGVPLALTIVTTEGDYNADGYADRALYLQNGPTPGVGQWALAHVGVGIPQVISFGASSDTPLRADFDGDGVDDLAVFRVSTAEWFILNLPRGTFRAVQFGPAGASLPVPADYDGDGRADLAVYVPATAPGTTSTWFVNGSRDGVTRATSFGGGGHQPVPADYDNDGRADLAVYQPASAAAFAQWFVLGSRGGFVQVTFGGAGHQPVPADYDATAPPTSPSTSPARGRPSRSGSSRVARRLPQAAFGGAGHVPVPKGLRQRRRDRPGRLRAGHGAVVLPDHLRRLQHDAVRRPGLAGGAGAAAVPPGGPRPGGGPLPGGRPAAGAGAGAGADVHRPGRHGPSPPRRRRRPRPAARAWTSGGRPRSWPRDRRARRRSSGPGAGPRRRTPPTRGPSRRPSGRRGGGPRGSRPAPAADRRRGPRGRPAAGAVCVPPSPPCPAGGRQERAGRRVPSRHPAAAPGASGSGGSARRTRWSGTWRSRIAATYSLMVRPRRWAWTRTRSNRSSGR